MCRAGITETKSFFVVGAGWGSGEREGYIAVGVGLTLGYRNRVKLECALEMVYNLLNCASHGMRDHMQGKPGSVPYCLDKESTILCQERVDGELKKINYEQ